MLKCDFPSAGWIRDKHMKVLQFWSDAHRETPIDMFVSEPFPFDEEFARSIVKPLHESLHMRFVSIPTLIRMKEPYIDTEAVSADPLKPGDDREFRLTFETVPENWNTQMPEVRVIHTEVK